MSKLNSPLPKGSKMWMATYLGVLMLFVVGSANGTFTFSASFHNSLTQASFFFGNTTNCKTAITGGALLGQKCTYAWFNASAGYGESPSNLITQQGKNLVVQSSLGCKLTNDFPPPFYRVFCPDNEDDESFGFTVFYLSD